MDQKIVNTEQPKPFMITLKSIGIWPEHKNYFGVSGLKP